MPLRLLLTLITIFLSVRAHALTTPKERILTWVDAEIELANQRYMIIADGLNHGKYEGLDATEGGGFVLRKRLERDIEALRQRWDALKALRGEIAADVLNETETIKKVGNMQRGCNLPECLKILGTVNAELAAQIGDITNHIVVENWKEFSVTKGDPAAEGRMQTVADMVLRQWACDRALSRPSIRPSIDGKQMGRCFASLNAQAAVAAGVQPQLALDPFPVNIFTGYRTPQETLDRIVDRVMKMPDYQVNPMQLFGLCAQETKGAFGAALNVCYELLRMNRQRPDFSRKLFDIRGDRASGGDNAGDWYHVFMMAKFSSTYGSWVTVGGYGANMLYEMAVQRNDPIETANDFVGADVGVTAYEVMFPQMAVKTLLFPPAALQAPEAECNWDAVFTKR